MNHTKNLLHNNGTPEGVLNNYTEGEVVNRLSFAGTFMSLGGKNDVTNGTFYWL
jgi:hypothetical protein